MAPASVWLPRRRIHTATQTEKAPEDKESAANCRSLLEVWSGGAAHISGGKRRREKARRKILKPQRKSAPQTVLEGTLSKKDESEAGPARYLNKERLWAGLPYFSFF